MTARLACALVLIALFGSAPPAAAETGLPPTVAAVLRAAKVPESAVGALVQDVDGGPTELRLNADQPFNPASVMKLVTTAAGLELLGPAYTWRTEALVTGQIRNGLLEGDLHLRGGGDPRLTLDALWLWLRELRARGLRDIRGDVVLDRTLFQPGASDPGRFDGQPLRTYNVIPDALLVNYKALQLTFVPDGKRVDVYAEPEPAQLDLVSRIDAVGGGCGDWRGRLDYELDRAGERIRLVFTGAYPASCGERVWSLAPFDHREYVEGVLRELWTGLGGTIGGKVRDGEVPPVAHRYSVRESPVLAEQIRDINKWSNNVMARQLFLTLGAHAGMTPAREVDGAVAVQEWLRRIGVAMPGLVLENGAGLSRRERLTAAGLGQLLLHMWRGPTMPEYVSSLPIYGVDGTLRKRGRRSDAGGRAHLKGGTLDGVRAVAGYVLGANGHRHVIVFIVNHPNAAATAAAQDALIDWVYSH